MTGSSHWQAAVTGGVPGEHNAEQNPQKESPGQKPI